MTAIDRRDGIIEAAKDDARQAVDLLLDATAVAELLDTYRQLGYVLRGQQEA